MGWVIKKREEKEERREEDGEEDGEEMERYVLEIRPTKIHTTHKARSDQISSKDFHKKFLYPT